MADFLDEKVKEIEARLKELRPLVDEYNRLEAALERLHRHDDHHQGRARAPPPVGVLQRPPRPPARLRHARRAGALLVGEPGITIPELADAMGIKQNYLYRVMPGLAEEGKVTKSGRGWHLRN